MKRILLLMVLLGWMQARTAAQTALYVDSSVVASGAGTSWAAAYKTVREALAAAHAGPASVQYNIYIAKGTYVPSTSATNGYPVSDSSFLITRGKLRLYGGYPTGGGPRDPALYPTILSKNPNPGVGTYRIVLLAGTTAVSDTVALDGLTIRDGAASQNNSSAYYNNAQVYASRGAGITMASFSSPVWLNTCTVTNNTAVDYGGGLNATNTRVLVTGCTFQGNSALGSGGAQVSGKTAVFSNCLFYRNQTNSIYSGGGCGGLLLSGTSRSVVAGCTFTENKSAGDGGGLYSIYDSMVTVSNCTFTSNAVFQSANGGGMMLYNAYNSLTTKSTVSNCSFTDNRAVSHGFLSWPYVYDAGGGGLYIGTSVSGSSPLITGCTFLRNVAERLGGGIWVDNCSPTITNCSFTLDTAAGGIGSNGLPTAGMGGGMYAFMAPQAGASLPEVSNCTFTNNYAYSCGGMGFGQTVGAAITKCAFVGNKATTDGGGLGTTYVGVIDRCTFRGNSAGRNGGGLGVSTLYQPGSSLISNCQFSGNYADTMGGALYASYANLGLSQCTFAGDSAGHGGTAGIFVAGAGSTSSNAAVSNCIVWDGPKSVGLDAPTATATYSYCIIQQASGIYPGTANLNMDPRFLAPVPSVAAPTTAGNYRLQACSPAINSGNNATTSYTGVLDLADSARLVNSIVDRGAYEYANAPVTATPITGGTAVCPTATLQLSHAQTGGTWSTITPGLVSVTGSGLVTGIAAGSAFVQYSYPTSAGCLVTAQYPVTVNAAPPLALTAGPSSLCAGATASFANAVAGGAWSSSNTALATISSAGLVTAVAAGTDTIRYTASNSQCTLTASYPLLVKPLPVVSPITGNPLLCVGHTTQLSSTPSGGAWSTVGSGTGIISTSGYLVGLQAGADTVVYTVTQAGCASSQRLPVLVGAAKKDSVVTTTCSKQPYAFGGQSLTATGLYFHTFQTAVFGCDSVVTLYLTVNTVDTGTYQSGNFLYAASQPGATYQWITCGGGPVAGATDASFGPPADGSYAVIVSVAGCTDTSACRTILRTAVASATPSAFRVYPNPANDWLTLEGAGAWAGAVRLLDVTGRVLAQADLYGGRAALYVGTYAPGTYFIQATDRQGGSLTTRVVLSR